MATQPNPRSFREKLEALMFAGLKPGMRSSEIKQLTWKDYVGRGIAGLAVAAVLGAFLYWVTANGRPDFQRAWDRFAGSEIAGIEAADVELIDLSMDLESEPKMIGGKVRNNSENNYSRVEVTFALTDQNGSAVGAEKVSVSNVQAKTAVPFRASISTKEAAYYVIREIQTF